MGDAPHPPAAAVKHDQSPTCYGSVTGTQSHISLSLYLQPRRLALSLSLSLSLSLRGEEVGQRPGPPSARRFVHLQLLAGEDFCPYLANHTSLQYSDISAEDTLLGTCKQVKG